MVSNLALSLVITNIHFLTTEYRVQFKFNDFAVSTQRYRGFLKDCPSGTLNEQVSSNKWFISISNLCKFTPLPAL